MEKNCRKCDVPLIADANWSAGKYTRNQHICNPCENARGRERRANTDNGYYKKWVSNNVERMLWLAARHRALKDNIPFDIELSDIIIPEFCPALGMPLQRGRQGGSDSSPTLDKFIPELGYVRGNVAVISGKANRIKSNATAEEVTAVAKWMSCEIKVRIL